MIAKTKEAGNIPELTKIVKATNSLPTIRYVDPEYVYIAVTNARCPQAEVYVKAGDKVKVGQPIGLRKGPFFTQPFHSTVSGEVVGIVKKFHRSGKLVEFVQIKNDKKDEFHESCNHRRTDEEIAALTREDFVRITHECSLVGLGGSSFPTYIKFQTKDPIHTICINAIECEPYLSADHSLVMKFTHRVITGITYALQAFKAEKAIIAIKKKYTDLEEVLTAVINRHGLKKTIWKSEENNDR
jgi:electron transport complex protein RnfC